jgi:hypothetical protein
MTMMMRDTAGVTEVTTAEHSQAATTSPERASRHRVVIVGARVSPGFRRRARSARHRST